MFGNFWWRFIYKFQSIFDFQHISEYMYVTELLLQANKTTYQYLEKAAY